MQTVLCLLFGCLPKPMIDLKKIEYITEVCIIFAHTHNASTEKRRERMGKGKLYKRG